jgi:small subunit ribosomal protein S2
MTVEIKTEDLLIPLDDYLAAGMHIGTQVKTDSMSPFVYRVRSDGLYVLDIRKANDRIRVAGKLIARYEPSKVIAASCRQYGQRPVQKFCEVTRAKPVVGRIVPGTLTNPFLETYMEPDIIIITDPRADVQALEEALAIGIPVIALCDTDNVTTNVDLVIPTNNKGRRALALVYWLLARQVLRERGEIQSTQELAATIDEFESRQA